ncbi:MAG TPA: M20/M25/M40 family metallo-hydrolase [Solirubrobacteraceae bacterium]|nr:M20/M25/M40 family metallo-hydrolase [Solirubrobacteraceae bacterium]
MSAPAGGGPSDAPMSAEPAGPATLDEVERRYLHDIFAELCAIESPSGRERACAARITEELRGLGIEVYEDDAGLPAGSDCGNLLARIEAPPVDRRGDAGAAAANSGRARAGGSPRATAGGPIEGERLCILLCAHMDTVPPQAPVEPVLRDGFWENANDGILGADNKAAVAVLLALARHLHRDGVRPCSSGLAASGPPPGGTVRPDTRPAAAMPPVDIELLFTVGEEQMLAGARAFDRAQLRSHFGYVFDHASPIGELVLSSPTHHRLQATFRGVAAHAGVRPEEGRSAILAAARAVADMRLGRIDAHTTANVGTIAGGSAINVVPERCAIVAEVRALREQRGEQLVAELLDCVHEAANLPECECDVDVTVERTFAGYRTSPSAPAVRAAERALRACCHEPVRISSGGASDANALIAAGLTVVNLANGTERNHEPGERVSAAALEAMLEIALALPAAAAAHRSR